MNEEALNQVDFYCNTDLHQIQVNLDELSKTSSKTELENNTQPGHPPPLKKEPLRPKSTHFPGDLKSTTQTEGLETQHRLVDDHKNKLDYIRKARNKRQALAKFKTIQRSIHVEESENGETDQVENGGQERPEPSPKTFDAKLDNIDHIRTKTASRVNFSKMDISSIGYDLQAVSPPFF